MLEIKNISKYFNSNLVLDNISFNVPKGKIFGIIGPNGAGKTTTLRIILGILSSSAGEIKYDNESLDQNFLNTTGYLPEERGLYPKSNVVNTLVYLSQLKGMKFKASIERTEYWLERLGLIDYRKFKIEELSKGNQQKVQFISAIIHDPKILILDEPFSGFDPVNQSIFREIIEENKEDRYIILSTHLMDLAESLCDEIILINKGKSIISGQMGEILDYSEKNLYKVYFEKEAEFDCPDDCQIIDKDKTAVTLDIKNLHPGEILQKINLQQNVHEFVRIKPSLHQLFISLVEESNQK